MASNPLWFLKLVFRGRFFEFRLPNFAFVTQGGLPMIKILVSEGYFLEIYLKS
jgi:hypothetical protein